VKKDYFNPKELSAPRFYTHAVAATGGGRLVYVSSPPPAPRGTT
jgi:hypothetical protein